VRRLYDDGSGNVLLPFNVVHSVHTFSEFQSHGLQKHDSRAHYHFLPPRGVRQDAAAFLDKLQQASYQPTGAGLCQLTAAPPHAC
jgi:hypothetical protein